MEKSTVLDIDAILNKEFSIDFKGYSPIEVDSFLDTVARDYETFNKIIDELNERLAEFETVNDELKTKIINLETRLKTAQENTDTSATPVVANLSQVDILRRIARLEQEVFNNRK